MLKIARINVIVGIVNACTASATGTHVLDVPSVILGPKCCRPDGIIFHCAPIEICCAVSEDVRIN